MLFLITEHLSPDLRHLQIKNIKLRVPDLKLGSEPNFNQLLSFDYILFFLDAPFFPILKFLIGRPYLNSQFQNFEFLTLGLKFLGQTILGAKLNLGYERESVHIFDSICRCEKYVNIATFGLKLAVLYSFLLTKN